MSDMDIVERLRNLVILDEVGSNNSLANEAADMIEALRKDSDFFQGQAHRLRAALRRITEVEPGTVTTTYDMRRIATEALTPNERR